MNSVYDPQGPISLVGEALGIDLVLDTNGNCAFTFDQVHRVDIRFDKGKTFALRAELSSLSGDAARMAAALELNVDPEMAAHRRLGYCPQEDRLVLIGHVDVTGKDPQADAEAIAGEVLFAAEVVERIAKAAGGSRRRAEDTAPETPDDLDVHFIQV
ncbi:MAG: CesT family type III secretion system chaperone [Pseudomonadota bacterium]